MPQEALILAAPPLDNSAPGKPSRRAWNIESDVKRSSDPPRGTFRSVGLPRREKKERNPRPNSSDVISSLKKISFRGEYACTRCKRWEKLQFLRIPVGTARPESKRPDDGIFQVVKLERRVNPKCFQRYSWSALDASIIHEVLVARPLERASNVRKGPRSL